MRFAPLAAGIAALAAAAAPSPATAAGSALQLELFDGAHLRRPSLHTPDLQLPGGQVLGLAQGAAAVPERQVDPPVALVLGVVPGFGLGHYLAGSRQWPIWLITDLVIFVVWPGGFVFTSSSGYAYLGFLVLVERLVEGIDAYQSGGARPFPEDLVAPVALALPVGGPRSFLP